VRSLREVDRLYVFGEKNNKGVRKKIGRIIDVLFHPSEPRVVGFIVERPDILMMVKRNDNYLALDSATIEEDRVLVSGKGAFGSAAARRLGFDWEKSVVWRGMPVRTESGRLLGEVRDALFEESDGKLDTVGLTGGVTADVALGVRDFDAALVIGFRTDAVVVADKVFAVETDGGVAAAAGRGTAVAKDQAGKAAVAATKAAKTAAAYGTAAVKVAAKSETTRKAFGFMKRMSDKVIEATKAPEDDE
jgi:uncharacterized protein YrrD